MASGSKPRDGIESWGWRADTYVRPCRVPTIHAADHSSDWPGSLKRNFTETHRAVIIGDGSLVFSYNHGIVAYTKTLV